MEKQRKWKEMGQGMQRGGSRDNIWNMFAVISQEPDRIVVLRLVDQSFSSNFSTIRPFLFSTMSLSSMCLSYQHILFTDYLDFYALRSGSCSQKRSSLPFKRQSQAEAEKWPARLLNVHLFESRGDKCGHKNSFDQSSCILCESHAQYIISLRQRCRAFSSPVQVFDDRAGV